MFSGVHSKVARCNWRGCRVSSVPYVHTHSIGSVPGTAIGMYAAARAGSPPRRVPGTRPPSPEVRRGEPRIRALDYDIQGRPYRTPPG